VQIRDASLANPVRRPLAGALVSLYPNSALADQTDGRCAIVLSGMSKFIDRGIRLEYRLYKY
jgi:hypothetical protein